MKPSDIEQISYSWKYFSPDTMSYARRKNIVIYRNGRIKVSSADTEKKTKSLNWIIKSSEEFLQLEHDINDCIENANQCDFLVDDCAVSITIYHTLNRIEKVERGLGYGNVTVDGLINSFIGEY